MVIRVRYSESWLYESGTQNHGYTSQVLRIMVIRVRYSESWLYESGTQN